MTQQDTGLYKPFAIVLGALVVFTLFIIVMANIFSPSTDYSKDPLIANSIKNQIEPVGRSNVRAVAETAPVEAEKQTASTDAAPASTEQQAVTEEAETEESATAATATDADTKAATDASVVAETSTSQESDAEPATADSSVEIPVKVRAVVATNCAGCHANGVKGAQRNDDTAAWQSLAGKGLEALTASVISGVGQMPARAESRLDDAELKLAVQHMINQNLGEQPATTATESDSDAAASATTEAAVATESAVTAESDAQAEEPAATEEAVAEAVVIPDNVKAAVDGLCAACHVSGVGNAPKYGDKADWDARMANGIDAITASAIAGKGAMPPRGGSQLTDEEIKLAIQYMITK